MKEILELIKKSFSKSKSMETFSFEDKRDSYWFNNDFCYIRLQNDIIVHVYKGSIDVSRGIKRVEILNKQLINMLNEYIKDKDIKPFNIILKKLV